jgi:hypothetical protein
MKITIEHHEEKFTYESNYDSIDMSELTEKLYGLCIAAGYHPDSVGECFYAKGQEMTEHLYSDDIVLYPDDKVLYPDDNDDNSMIDWMKGEEDIHSGVYEPEVGKSVVIESRYGIARKFTIVAKNCVEYSFKDDGHVGYSANDDGSLYSVDPSGGPFISIGTMLGNMHKDLEGLTVTKIKADENKSGVYYLTVK